jgi:hypothetical protein
MTLRADRLNDLVGQALKTVSGALAIFEGRIGPAGGRGTDGLDRVDALHRAGLQPFGLDDLETGGLDEGQLAAGSTARWSPSVTARHWAGPFVGVHSCVRGSGRCECPAVPAPPPAAC